MSQTYCHAPLLLPHLCQKAKKYFKWNLQQMSLNVNLRNNNLKWVRQRIYDGGSVEEVGCDVKWHLNSPKFFIYGSKL